ncbi:MAG TPA: head GIN domain-containing protein, partial [Myxococcaceae bacterium]|nr:head GIN domain-containing protein [Myxococcaceae bacterium]
MRLLPLALAACTVALPAFAGETRTLSGFTKIDLAAPVDVEVRPGAFQVTLEMDSDVARHLVTQIDDETLRISMEGHNLNFHGKPRIKVRMPAFKGLVIQGSGDADIAGFKAQEKVGLQISGSGDIRYKGTAPGLAVGIEGSGDVLLAEGDTGSLQCTIQGSGNLKASDFKAKNVSVAIDGSGNADIRVSGGAL